MSDEAEDFFFENFVTSVGATRQLLGQAHKSGSLIEGLILYSAIIDAFLRNLIALDEGIKNEVANPSDLHFGPWRLDAKYFEHQEGKIVHEKTIYQLANERQIITQYQLTDLYRLYELRNRIVHRFITSNVKYADLEKALAEYETIYQDLLLKLKKIEGGSYEPKGKELSRIHRMVREKIFGPRRAKK